VPAPIAKRIPTVHPRVSGPVVDDWAWLRDRDDPDTLAYLAAENAFADEWFAPRAGLRERIFDEIKRRTQETDLTVPVRKGPWWYLSHTVEGLSYPIHVRRPHSDDTSGEVVLVDENVEAAGHEYFALGVLEVSPDHRWLAWSTDHDGGEEYVLGFRDLLTGDDLPDRIERTGGDDVAWSRDGRHCFYLRLDDAMRTHEVWRHELGTPAESDELVHTEPDERFHLGVGLTRSEAFVVISAASRTTRDALVVPADDPTARPRAVVERRDGHEYDVDHRGDDFVILTNLDAEDFRLVSAPVDNPGPSHWTEVVAHQPGRRLRDVDAFEHFVLLHEWEDGLPRLRLLFDDGSSRRLGFDDPVHGVEAQANPSFDTTTVRFEHESYVVPAGIFDEDVTTGQRELRKRVPVLGGFDPADYVTQRTWATATDGTRVPVDVTRARRFDGPLPTVLYGYAAYEISLPPWFSVARLSLLDRGVAFAVAHPRGGGEMGRRWYLEGKLRHKTNSFTDFLACARHLCNTGIAHEGRVAARGGSAGGLLVAAAATIDPKAFAAVVAEVPFVDVVTTMLDPTLPLTVIEWEEWGDPREAGDESYMASYSPYDNVSGVAYPPMLVTAGLNDPRVSYHEPAKWVARLRATAAADSGVLLLRTEMEAGHMGSTGRYDAWRDEARVLSFLLHHLGRGDEQ
jgi:oligopeptidase B